MRRNDFQYVCSNGFPKEPVVSVLVLAYNHEKFIAQALDSIVCQLTDFPYEIVVGEDCSSDATKEICMDYQRRYPDKVKLLLQKKNKGLIGNFCDTLRTCKGKYIAECAGDDFWNDCHKLQKHVDYMNRHEDAVVTYHDACLIDEEGVIFDESYLKDYKKNYSTLDLQKTSWIIPSSMCYRSVIVPELLSCMNRKIYTEDVFMISIMGNYGEGRYLDSVKNISYRFSRNSIWSMQSDEHKLLLALGTLGELTKYRCRKKENYLRRYFLDRFMSGLANLLGRNFSKLDRKIYLQILIRNIKLIGIKNFLYHIKVQYIK